MRSDDFTALTAPLRALGGGRVWSLMVSLFGDLAQEEGRAIDGPVLSAMMSLLAVRPEAARVALHRLRNDGWIVSQKRGRISRHALSAQGLAESAAASPRIYARPEDRAEAWQLVLLADPVTEADEHARLAGFTPLLPRVYLGPEGAPVPDGALALPATAAPDWLKKEVRPAALDTAYADLHQTLAALSTALPADVAEIRPIERAVLRCLIVHNWRRLVLKHPMLPAPLVDPAWPGHLCHLEVVALLDRLPCPALTEITAELATA